MLNFQYKSSAITLALVVTVLSTTTTMAAEMNKRDVVGNTYPVVEPDFVEEMKEKAANINLEEVYDHDKWEEKIKGFQPSNIVFLPRAEVERTRFIDMIFTLDKDIKDAKGEILYPKGYQYNPMEYLPASSIIPTIVVIDGSDEEQIIWYEKSEFYKRTDVRVLLCGGSYFKVGTRLDHTVFYLMKPVSDRFKLEYAPSIIRPSHTSMRVDEVVIAVKEAKGAP